MDNVITVHVFGEDVAGFLLTLSEYSREPILDDEGTNVWKIRSGVEHQITLMYHDATYRFHQCLGPYLDEDQKCVGVVFIGPDLLEDCDLPADRKRRYALNSDTVSPDMPPLAEWSVDFRIPTPQTTVGHARRFQSGLKVLNAVAELVKNTKTRKRSRRD